MRKYSRTHAQLEREMNAARQLRSETLASAACSIASRLASVFKRLHRALLRLGIHAPRGA